ncbi:MAG: aminotransferase class I/II-fold pyridoxal phosphate-dependent enzyme [Bacteroidota bacterium]|nr:aminotransferase class I/II-fold pyridoxal phosphate-dependent enzyme [Bacteroidota bacterium]
MTEYRINLISDTVTMPTAAMKEAMIQAPLGDDVFRMDPTVNQLEHKLADLFGHEAGLFCPSGTMTNQIAIKAHTQPLDEVICDIHSHIYQYEVGGYAFHSGVAINPIYGNDGKLTVDLIQDQIKPAFDWLPRTKLVVLENTCNRAGGNYYELAEMKSLSTYCKKHELNFHLDGARIFNALIESKDDPRDVGVLFDSISICLSKGLGAPVGSVLIGSSSFINYCRRIRKVFGGGMRQAGILAAAGIYALDHNIQRLKIDHDHAKIIAKTLVQTNYLESIKVVKTNIIIFDLIKSFDLNDFIEQLHGFNIHASAFGKHSVRFVTHMDINSSMVDEVCHVLLNNIRPGT